jgi:nitrogen-specific signal transduction histidine kinase/CheY-like chemotaxis protein
LARRQLEAQLRESQKMESIGTLAGGIAHDFNNILGAILGHAALMREEISPGHPALDGLEQITRAGTRARDLVQQILAFSRRQPQQLKTQKMQPLLDETAALLRATLPARVTLSSEVQAAPLFVRADSTQLQQVLVNLCTNAWHALQGSTGQIVLGLDEKVLDVGAPQPGLVGLPSGAYVHLWVKDNGVGMDRATQARIFEPFFTTKSVGEGTGLGLSVVHGIVAAHRGVITVDSAPGKGSTFHVYLPAIQAASASPDDALAGAVLPACGQGQRIAYIDDDEVMTLMVERLLKHAGYQVSTFLDPLAALPVLQARPQDIDVVVTDFNMPQMSGVELAAHLRQIRPDWPIVISSGYLSDELLGSARAMGINALLQKQNTLEELAGLIQQVLGANVA